MGRIKLDIDTRVDLPPVIDHWCKWCERVHEFQLMQNLQAYSSMRDCEGFVTLIQLSIEGRLIESKWKGIAKNRPPRTIEDLE